MRGARWAREGSHFRRNQEWRCEMRGPCSTQLPITHKKERALKEMSLLSPFKRLFRRDQERKKKKKMLPPHQFPSLEEKRKKKQPTKVS